MLAVVLAALGSRRANRTGWHRDTIPAGQGPLAVEADQRASTVYMTNEHLNTVSVISERTLAVIATVATGIGTSGVAVNPVTNTICATSHADSTVVVIR